VTLKRKYFCPEPKPIIRPSSGIKVKLSLYQAVEALSVVRRLESHIFLDNRLTDVGEVLRFLVLIPAGRISSIEKSNDLIGNRTHL
jgi:hypothetical protein